MAGTIYGESILNNDTPLSLTESDEILHILDEAYFGKTEDIMEAEELLHNLRKPYLAYDGKYGQLKDMKVNSSKEILAFDRKIEKIFGFGVFSLYINANIVPNAWTVPVSYAIDYSVYNKNILVDVNGYKFKKKTDFALNCTITSGLIFNPNFTDGEILAIILHEIGHNFQAELNHTVASFTSNRVFITFVTNFLTMLSTGSPAGLVGDVTRSNEFRSWAERLKRNFRKIYPLYAQIVDFLSWFGNAISNGATITTSILNALTLGVGGISNIFTAFINLFTKFMANGPVGFIWQLLVGFESSSGEKIADNFASMYGYGPELSSALGKMGSQAGNESNFVTRFVDSVPVWGTIVHTLELPAQIISYTFDPHPQSTYRLMDQIKYLEHELSKTDIDPKMKDRIKKDITDLKADYKKYMAVMRSDDAYIAKKMYNEHLAKNYKNDALGLKKKERDWRYSEYDNVDSTLWPNK